MKQASDERPGQHTDISSVLGFLSVATPTSAERPAVASLVAAADGLSKAVGMQMSPSRRIRLVMGRDSGLADSGDIRRWIWRRLASDVDFVLAIAYGPTTGCWAEVSWASELGIPTAVAVPSWRSAAPLIGNVPGRGPISLIEFSSADEFGRKWQAWLRRNELQIASGPTRRAALVAATKTDAIACGVAWNTLEGDERHRVAWSAGMSRDELFELLVTPSLFASAAFEVRRQVMSELSTKKYGGLDLHPSFFTSFADTVAEYNLDAYSATKAFENGIAYELRRHLLEETGHALRKPQLATHLGWKRHIIDQW